MTPPAILLDSSYLQALVSGDEPVVGHYRQLVQQYRARSLRLVALDVDLAEFGGATATVLAPVDTIHAAGQHKNAAADAHSLLPSHLALAAVIVTREKIRRVATIDPAWVGFDIAVELPTADVAHDPPAPFEP
jgi:hypothetical protein